MYPFCVGRVVLCSNFAAEILINYGNMKAITLKKKWVEKLEEMDKELKFKCLVALYEYLSNECPTIEMMQGFEVAHFIKFVMEDIRKTEERRERNRQRRAEKAAREAAEREKAERLAAESAVSAPVNIDCQSVDNPSLYASNPELYIFDGFMRYVIATGDNDCRSIVPSRTTLHEMLVRFRQWVITRRRSREITRLTAFRGLFRHALKEIS